MSGILALSLFGNIVVATLHLLEEIAKEGILPFSRFFARSTTTPIARIGQWLRSRKESEREEEPLEQSPAGALLLHWVFAVIMIAASSGEKPVTAYSLLFSLYSYVTTVILGFFVAAGLLYLKWHDRREWVEMRGFKPWGGPTAPIIYTITCGFMTVAPLVPSYDIITSIPWYVVPTVGLSSFILGVGYFAVFRYVIPQINGKQPVVERLPVVDCNEKGGWVLRYEIMEFEWQVPERRLSEGHAMN
ncbi:hypothetical protein MMC16_005874 [Acarospora aff. strigata]|nr:hypothetical protein [Acarospora aff. strigata]